MRRFRHRQRVAVLRRRHVEAAGRTLFTVAAAARQIQAELRRQWCSSYFRFGALKFRNGRKNNASRVSRLLSRNRFVLDSVSFDWKSVELSRKGRFSLVIFPMQNSSVNSPEYYSAGKRIVFQPAEIRKAFGFAVFAEDVFLRKGNN